MAARLWVVSFIVQESSVCPAKPQWKLGLLAAAEVVRATLASASGRSVLYASPGHGNVSGCRVREDP